MPITIIATKSIEAIAAIMPISSCPVMRHLPPD
jgi:hypothetical protein